MTKICLCTWCINGIRSHGEPVYVGDQVEDGKCELCGDTTEDEDVEALFECILD